MRLFLLSCASIVAFGASLSAEPLDIETGRSVAELVEIETSLKENYGVTDFLSFAQKLDEMNNFLRYLEDLEARSGVSIQDADNRNVMSLVLEDKENLISLYKSYDPKYQARLKLYREFGIYDWEGFVAKKQEFERLIRDAERSKIRAAYRDLQGREIVQGLKEDMGSLLSLYWDINPYRERRDDDGQTVQTARSSVSLDMLGGRSLSE